MASYPAAFDDFTPLTGAEFCDTGIPQDGDLASRLNRLSAALTAIQAELGLDPSGVSATVAAALSTETAARVDADTGHVNAANPHPQYLTPAAASGAYEPAGTVGAALAAAEANAGAQIGVHNAATSAVHGITDTGALIVTGDPRLTDARVPLAHADSHTAAGADALALDELAAPTSNVSMGGQRLLSLAAPSEATDAATKEYVDARRWPAVAPLTVTTPTLSAGASWAAAMNGPTGFRLLNITTSAAARVRVYVTTQQRDNDVARPTGTDPAGDHGCLLDFVTTPADLAWSLSPVVDAAVTGGAIPITITNLAAAPAAITVTFEHVRTI